MKLVSIRIPLTPPGQTIPEELGPALRRAAFEELCTLIPGLVELKNTIPSLGTTAIGNQLFLSATLIPVPQLPLRLSATDWKLGRVVEIDSTVLDQAEVRSSLLLTKDLLAAAELGEPAAIREWLDKHERSGRSRAANRLRRALGRRYELDVFDTPELVALPGIAPTRLEDQERTISAIVTQMKGRTTFWAHRLTETRTDGQAELNVDPRQVWTMIRRGQALSFSCGQVIHQSMERRGEVNLQGRLVVHELTDSPVAMEVESVSTR